MELTPGKSTRLFPEMIFICPYCKNKVIIPAGLVVTDCDRCHKSVFRPLPKTGEHDQEKPLNRGRICIIPGVRPETPLIGIQLQHIPYIRCPATDEMIPAESCYCCEAFNRDLSTSKDTVCNHVDDNPDLVAAIRNREQIIAACIRGDSGYECTVWADAVVDEWDRG